MRFISRLSLLKSAISGRPARTAPSKASKESKPLKFGKFNFHDLELMYRRQPYLFRAVNIRASFATPKFKIYTDTTEGEKAVGEFLTRIHCKRDLSWLNSFLHNRFIDADVFGNAWTEYILNEDEDTLMGLQHLHPAYIGFQRDHGTNGPIKTDDDDNPVGITQEVPYYDTKKERTGHNTIDVPMELIAHLTLHNIGDELLGIPLTEVAYQSALSQMNTELGFAEAIYRHGFPLQDIEVGDERHEPNPEIMEDIEKEVKDLNYMSEYVHEYWIKVKNLESYSLPGTVNFSEPFINAIATASGIPKFLLRGTGEGTNRATAQAMLDLLPSSIFPLRRKMKLLLENQIFAKLFELEGIDDQIRIEFNEVLPREDDRITAKLLNLSKVRFEDRSLLTYEEAREMLGLSAGPVLKKEGKMKAMLSEVEDGIYLVAPHGELIYLGKKTAFVKSKKFEMAGKKWYLCSGKLVYGIIEPKEPITITAGEFSKYFPQHLVSREEREAWWAGKDTFYLYHFDFKPFETPLKYHYRQGIQTIIKDVEFI